MKNRRLNPAVPPIERSGSIPRRCRDFVAFGPTVQSAWKNRAPEEQPLAAERSPEPQIVEIERPVYGGAFLARIEGKATFVPLVLPGERARVRIVEEKRGYSTAELEEIVAFERQRAAPACGHFGACGGCQYQHAQYAAQLEIKEAILRETLGRAGVHAPKTMTVLAGEPWGYRNRIRVAFDAEGNVGYRGRRSHRIGAIAECPIAAPLLAQAALHAGEIARNLPVRARPSELSLFCNAAQTELLASANVASDWALRDDDFSRMLAQRVPETKGAELAATDPKGSASRRIAMWGAESLFYRAAGFDYRVDQGAFFQVNRWLLNDLVDRVAAGRSGGLAWDLFAGVGLFARRLASEFARVVAVESAPAAIEALKENLHGTAGTAVKSKVLDFLRAARRKERPDLIVVDPPRTGLGAEITARLGEISAQELVYVSCDPATLARDLRALLSAGYAIDDIALADLFPQTFHLESVVRLRR